MPLSNDFTAVFERDGIVELGMVLGRAELATLRDRLDRLCLPQDGGRRPEVRDLADSLSGPTQASVMQRVNLYRHDEAFDALMRRDDFLDAAQAALGPNIQLFRDQCFYKPALCGGEVYMHQDNRYWHLDPPSAVILFIALDDCTVETGCVHFIKGSHRWGRVEHERAGGGTSVLLEARADKKLSVPVEVPAGHATLHHCQILHWSPPNRSSRPRRAHTIEYVTAGTRCRGEVLVDLPLLRGISSREESCVLRSD
jgi:2-oxoglutarate-dependent dioxygenase